MLHNLLTDVRWLNYNWVINSETTVADSLAKLHPYCNHYMCRRTISLAKILSFWQQNIERDLCFLLFFLRKNKQVLISVTPGIHPHVCCFIAISTTFHLYERIWLQSIVLCPFNSILITFSALSDVFSFIWHYHWSSCSFYD